MKVTTLFVIGLLVGACTVFVFRALALDDAPDHSGPHAAATDPAHVHKPGIAPEQAPTPAADPAVAAPSEVERAPSSPVAARTTPSAGSGEPVNLICPVMGNEVDPDIYVDHAGRRIGFCCPGCDDVFLNDPATYLKKVDAELKRRGITK